MRVLNTTFSYQKLQIIKCDGPTSIRCCFAIGCHHHSDSGGTPIGKLKTGGQVPEIVINTMHGCTVK